MDIDAGAEVVRLWELAMATDTDKKYWRLHLDADTFRHMQRGDRWGSISLYGLELRWRDIPVTQHLPPLPPLPNVPDAQAYTPYMVEPKTLIALEVRGRASGFSHYFHSPLNDPVWLEDMPK